MSLKGSRIGCQCSPCGLDKHWRVANVPKRVSYTILSLLPSAGWKASSSLRATGLKSNVADRVVCLLAAPQVQLLANADHGWRIAGCGITSSCQSSATFRDCKVLLLTNHESDLCKQRYVKYRIFTFSIIKLTVQFCLQHTYVSNWLFWWYTRANVWFSRMNSVSRKFQIFAHNQSNTDNQMLPCRSRKEGCT